MTNRNDEQRRCAHAWAHQHGQTGYSSNFFFEGNTIFSYGRHFPIATLYGQYVFFTIDDYSNTTSHHKALARSAVSHKNFVLVKEVPVNLDPRTNTRFQKINFDYWMTVIRDEVAEYNEHPRRKSILNKINDTIYNLRSFLNAVGLIPSDAVDELLNSTDLTEIRKIYAGIEAKEKRAAVRQKAKHKREFLKSLQLWESHEANSVRYGVAPEGISNLAYLRLNEDLTQIETSKGIEVPVAVAHRLFRHILSVLPAGCTDCQYSILNFNVDKISPEGLLVGCHFIPMSQIDKIAALLNWI